MNAYFFKMTNEERSNILDQHKEIYDGYVTSYAQQPNQQPLYVQDYANDKGGLTVNSRGEVTTYKNVGINEMHADGKSTGLFSDEEPKEGYISAGVEYSPEETFEGLHDMIGDGEDDLEHGVFGDEDESDMVLVSPEVNFDDEDDYSDDEYLHRKSGEGRDFYDDDDLVFSPDSAMFDDEDEDDSPFGLDINSLFDLDNEEDFIEEETKEQVVSKINESLDMFKRLSKYN